MAGGLFWPGGNARTSSESTKTTVTLTRRQLIGALLFFTALSYLSSLVLRPACESTQPGFLVRADASVTVARSSVASSAHLPATSTAHPVAAGNVGPTQLTTPGRNFDSLPPVSTAKAGVAVARPAVAASARPTATSTAHPVAAGNVGPTQLAIRGGHFHSPPPVPTEKAGIPAKALCPRKGSIVFSGSESDVVAILTKDSPQALDGDFTFEWWSKQTDKSGASPRIFSLYPQASSRREHVLLAVSLEKYAYLWTKGAATAAQDLSIDATLHTWQHWAVVRSGSTVTMYVMGVARASATLSGPLAAPGATLYIGGRDASDPHSSRIECLVTNFRVVGSALYLSDFKPPSHELTAVVGTLLLLAPSSASTLLQDLSKNFDALKSAAEESAEPASFSPDSPFTCGVYDPTSSPSPPPSPSETPFPVGPVTPPPCSIESVEFLSAAPIPSSVDCAAHGFRQRDAPAAIIDSFLLSYESDALFLRLLELENVVDTFVIVESRESFTGQRRSTLWDTHGPCFDRWTGRIVHHVVGKLGGSSPWERETWLRNQLAVGAALAARNLTDNGFKEDEILFAVSDIDELPRASSYAVAKHCEGYDTPIGMTLDRFHYYSLNWLKEMSWPLGPVLVQWSKREAMPPQWTRELKTRSTELVYAHGGWHMSYFMTVGQVINKLASFSHQEYNRAPYNSPKWIKQCLAKGEDLFGRDGDQTTTFQDCNAIDADVPNAVRINRDFFASFCPLVSPGVYRTAETVARLRR